MKRKFFDNSMKNFTSQNLFYFLDIHRINIPGFSTSSKYLIFSLRGHFIYGTPWVIPGTPGESYSTPWVIQLSLWESYGTPWVIPRSP